MSLHFCTHCNLPVQLTDSGEWWVHETLEARDACGIRFADTARRADGSYTDDDPEPEVTTEDGATMHPGDHAFDYYSMKSGTIGDDLDDSGWFTFHHDDGGSAVLNGARICTDAFAARKGWPGRGVIGL